MWLRRCEATAPPNTKQTALSTITMSCTQIVGALKA